MNLTPTTTASTKSPEPEPEPPTRIKPVSFTNGILKRHHLAGAALVVVTYKECLKNHAAALGGHALDGCGEFMPAPSSTSADPASLKCAACGCHRNFHRRDPEDPSPPPLTHVIEYQPHHRHHPPPPPPRSPNSASPPPISSSYYPSAPHMLLALSAANHPDPAAGPIVSPPNQATRKRFRTKFSHTQKEKMHEFADRIGWKIQKRDDELVRHFCHEIGVDRGVLKVWMHNNKNTLGKRDTNGDQNNVNHDDGGDNVDGGGGVGAGLHAATANGSSSSS